MFKPLLSFAFLLFAFVSIGQTNYDFTTPANLSGVPFKSTATIYIDGVSYTISGGINGDYTNVISGGNLNSAALKKEGSGGDNFTIKRTDGKRFQFYNLWLKQVSMYPYANTPPFYTIRFFNGNTELKSYSVTDVNDKTSTRTYTENLAVTSVNVTFSALVRYYIDDLKVGPATPSNDASLSSIILNKVTLSPAFNPGVFNYTASVGYGTDSINVSALVNDALGATVNINGEPLINGKNVALNIGNTTITIHCVAEDNVTTKTYTIVVNRSSAPAYCMPASDASYGDNVNSFTLQGENGTSVNDLNTRSALSGYVYRSTVPAVSLKQGKTYSGTLNTMAESYVDGDGDQFKIWIDYNDNYAFEVNELVYQSPGLLLVNASLSFSLQIPEGAALGAHRLRIRAVYQETYNASGFTACSDVEYGETQDYDVNIIAASATPLPLNLLSFNASPVDSRVLVNWVSAVEMNVDKFIVERSTDGITFDVAGSVNALNGQAQNNYSWLDAKPADGVNYYRLKMTDKNGLAKYSPVVTVKYTGRSWFVKVAPNPVVNHTLGLQLNNIAAGKYQVRLLNAKGQQVYKSIVQHNGGNASTVLTVPAYINSGLYSLQLTDQKQVFNTSVIIK